MAVSLNRIAYNYLLIFQAFLLDTMVLRTLLVGYNSRSSGDYRRHLWVWVWGFQILVVVLKILPLVSEYQ